MKNISALELGLLITFFVTDYSQIVFASDKYSSACELGTAAKSGEVAFFQHVNYKGTCVIRLAGRYSNAKAIGIGNDKISSVKVGAGTQVSLCNHSNFRGQCKVYTKSMASLGKMNDKTSSAIVGKVQKPPPARKPPGKAPPTKASSNGGRTSKLFAPSDLTVDVVTSTTIRLAWFDNSDREYGVEVYRSEPVEARQKGWEFIGLFEERIGSQITGNGWRSDEDYDLHPDTNYCYRLRSFFGFDRAEVSDYSELVCTKTTRSQKVTVKRK